MSVETELVDRVLLLPPDDRAALARKILLSLEATDFDADAEVAWDAEIEARLARFDRGETKAIDWRESVQRARLRLAEPRDK